MEQLPSGWWANSRGWSFGKPSSPVDPRGFSVIGNNLIGTGLYREPQTGVSVLGSTQFSTVGYTSATVTFDRFLGIASDDSARIEVCAGNDCTPVWLSNGATADASWQTLTYPFPPSKMGKQNVTVRFGLGPLVGTGQLVSFGWNIKQFVVKAIK